MNDSVIVSDAVKRFKWVGTRPIRPDGVPKVTGSRGIRRRLGAAGHAGRPDPALAARPCAHPARSIPRRRRRCPACKAVVTAADFPEQKFEYIGPERVAQNFWHMTRNIMAREKVLYEGHAVAAVAAISKSVSPTRRCR